MRCRFSADTRQTGAEDCSLLMSCKKKVHRHKYENKMFSFHQIFPKNFLIKWSGPLEDCSLSWCAVRKTSLNWENIKRNLQRRKSQSGNAEPYFLMTSGGAASWRSTQKHPSKLFYFFSMSVPNDIIINKDNQLFPLKDQHSSHTSSLSLFFLSVSS